MRIPISSAWLLLAAGLLLPRCHDSVGRRELRQAAFQTQRQGAGYRADPRLRAAGREGFDELLLAARAVGAANALQAAAWERKCPFFDLDGARRELANRDPEMPGQRAAAAAAAWLAEDPDLTEILLRAGDPLERALALLALTTQPERLLETLSEMDAERDPLVVETAAQVLECAKTAKPGLRADQLVNLLQAQASWSDRLERTAHLGRCEQPDQVKDFEALASALASGSLGPGGLSASNGEISIGLTDALGRKRDFSPACALAMYELLAGRGKHLAWLVAPITHWGTPAPAERRRAAELLVRDLERFPADQQNELLARALNAGAKSDRQIRYRTDEPFGQEHLLEAAARQGQAGAKAAIERYVDCRGTFTGCERLRLLGVLGTPAAADLAFRIGSHCGDALGDAVVALIRLGDPRAPGLLRRALRKHPFLPDELYSALAEHPSPELEQVIEEATRGDDPLSRRLLEYLKR